MRGLGYLPDAPDPRDHVFALHAAASDPVPAFASVDQPHIAAKSQGTTSSCVGNAEAAGLRLAYLARGIDCPELSALAVYRGARNIDGSSDDRGTYLRSGMRAIMDLGCPPERAFPFSELAVNDQLPFSALSAGYDRHGLRSYHRIETGDLDSIARALAAGLPVCAGFQVSEAFCSSNGRQIVGKQTAPIAGGHALCIVAVGSRDKLIVEFGDAIPPTTEPRLWRVLNSWGQFGYRGRFYASDAFIASATDIWAMDIVT